MQFRPHQHQSLPYKASRRNAFSLSLWLIFANICYSPRQQSSGGIHQQHSRRVSILKLQFREIVMGTLHTEWRTTSIKTRTISTRIQDGVRTWLASLSLSLLQIFANISSSGSSPGQWFSGGLQSRHSRGVSTFKLPLRRLEAGTLQTKCNSFIITKPFSTKLQNEVTGRDHFSRAFVKYQQQILSSRSSTVLDYRLNAQKETSLYYSKIIQDRHFIKRNSIPIFYTKVTRSVKLDFSGPSKHQQLVHLNIAIGGHFALPRNPKRTFLTSIPSFTAYPSYRKPATPTRGWGPHFGK